MSDEPATQERASPTVVPPHPLWFYGAALGIVLLDQLTKHLATLHLTPGQAVPVLGPIVSLTLRHNRGAAWGLFAAGGPYVAIVAALLVIAIAVWGMRAAGGDRWLVAGLCLLLGGAIGNLIDRVWLGHVVDFIDFHFWPVFNVADIAVVAGAVCICYEVLFGAPRRRGPEG